MPECKINDEGARIAALHDYELLDTEPEEAFDRITRLAKTVLQVPIVVVSLVDEDRQWFKSRQGMPLIETPRSVSFCTHTIRDTVPLIVEDAQADARFRDSPLVVGEPYIRYYAGVPLRIGRGHNIGALCAMDTKVRYLGTAQIRMLQDLARLVVDEIELRHLASTDSLTGAMSRRTFLEVAARDLARSRRAGMSLSCIVFDVDHFKSINDTYGHGVGDQVLQDVMSVCHAKLRTSDYVGRIGGEEFAIVCPDTPLFGASDVAERLRRALERLQIVIDGKRVPISASFGIAERTSPEQSFEDVMRHADAAMYLAKSSGRNRSVCHADGPCAFGVAKRTPRTTANAAAS